MVDFITYLIDGISKIVSFDPTSIQLTIAVLTVSTILIYFLALIIFTRNGRYTIWKSIDTLDRLIICFFASIAIILISILSSFMIVLIIECVGLLLNPNYIIIWMSLYEKPILQTLSFVFYLYSFIKLYIIIKGVKTNFLRNVYRKFAGHFLPSFSILFFIAGILSIPSMFSYIQLKSMEVDAGAIIVGGLLLIVIGILGYLYSRKLRNKNL